MNNAMRSRVVLYLGAGASQFAGYRTFADFPVLIFDANVRKTEGLPHLPSNAERLLAAIKDSLERTDGWTTHDRFLWRLNDYQQLLMLNQADPAIQPFLRDATRLFDLHICTAEAVNVMANTTVRHYSSNRVSEARSQSVQTYENMRRVFDSYLALAELNGYPPHLSIFTTNYDVLPEDLCTEFGTTSNIKILVNGFPHPNEKGVAWTPKVPPTSFQAPHALHLFHLHGCACWFYHSQGDGDIYYHRNEAPRSVRDLCAMYPGLERERGAGPHGHGFRAFYHALQSCDLVVFVGFSFRDDDVMHVLLKTLAEREGALKILLIDNMYTADDVQGRLRQAARRSTFPVHVPSKSEITAIKVNFGSEAGFDEQILDACSKLLRKDKKK